MSPDAPVFFLLAGPNGAGKSTLYRALSASGLIPTAAPFINADLHEAAQLQHIADPAARSEAARQWADAQRAACLDARRTFASETVFSHPSKLQLIEDARRAGFLVTLLVVGLSDPQRLLERVRQRVGEGGHDVPAQRILARYPRTLTQLAVAVRRAHLALLYDSQEVAPGTHRLVAVCQGASTRRQVEPMPAWARTVLGE